MEKIRIAAAANVEIPASLVLKTKGYAIRQEWHESSSDNARYEIWYAEKEGLEFIAGGLIELLGVVSVYEVRGQNWQAPDSEIDSFLKKYYGIKSGGLANSLIDDVSPDNIHPEIDTGPPIGNELI